ncbi:MAG TPA: rhomboid family intramembrane serine protease [Pirellulaceae bacterium]|jgi:membrane associated rhomboid family serine protease|nr:rhomboid family intramembrane serine protease [Pirellulaceae bacterium]
MGYQERDYYREDTGEDGFQIKSWTVRLIIANCAVFLANALTMNNGQSWLTPLLDLHGNAIVEPKLWYQFLTYGFVHNPDSLWHIVGNMIGLWVFGRAIEERYGGKEFLRYYLIAILLGGIVWSVRQYFVVGSFMKGGEPAWVTCVGASGGVTALIVLYCLLYPRNTLLLFFAIPTPAWMVGILIVASDLTGAWGGQALPPGMTRAAIAFDVHLTGAALALAYWALGLNFGRFPGWRELSAGWTRIKSLLRARPAVRIHDDADDDDDLETQADRLLEKIARQGESSLTPHERRVLENYSRRIRDKQR